MSMPITYLTDNRINTSQALHLFQDVIRGMEENLGRYAERKNASQWVIDRQNRWIGNLIQAYNSFHAIRLLPMWEQADGRIQELQLLDPTLAGHRLELCTQPGEGMYSFINLNALAHDAA